MRRDHDVAWFVMWFCLLSLILGAVFLEAASRPYRLSMNALAVPVLSAMLAARGFSWKRKLTYAGVTFAVYVGVTLGTGFAGLYSRFAAETAAGIQSLAALIFTTFLMAFPLAMLVLFVGRTPSLLWRKGPC